MGNRSRLAIGLALLAVTLSCVGQDAQPQTTTSQAQAKPTALTGSLSGIVYCGDTNLPARLAKVELVQVSNIMPTRGSLTAVTDLDGRFTIDRVPEDRYYVRVLMPGYMNTLRDFNEIISKETSPEEKNRLESLVPTAEVSASHPAEISIRLERAAEIDGTVTYDDGGPGVSLQVQAKRKAAEADEGAGKPTPGLSSGNAPTAGSYAGFSEMPPMVTTDDRGRFRILGVAPGEYLVSARVPSFSAEHQGTFNTGEAFKVFAGGGFRESKASAVKVGAGDGAIDADIMIPLSKLHTVSGQLVLKTTGQPAPMVLVMLFYADTREPAQDILVRGGVFEIHYVPEGSFILDAMPVGSSDDGQGGDAVETSVVRTSLDVIGDVDGIVIAVPEVKITRRDQQAPPASGADESTAPASN